MLLSFCFNRAFKRYRFRSQSRNDNTGTIKVPGELKSTTGVRRQELPVLLATLFAGFKPEFYRSVVVEAIDPKGAAMIKTSREIIKEDDRIDPSTCLRVLDLDA